ncbi:CCHC-type zinc finger protein, partial [Klebsiella pneumoniae]
MPVVEKDKSQVTCYECGTKGHYSNECPKKTAANAPVNAPAQQQRRVQPGRRFAPGNSLNRNGRLFIMHAEEAQ